jgi:hypothetical protein
MVEEDHSCINYTAPPAFIHCPGSAYFMQNRDGLYIAREKNRRSAFADRLYPTLKWVPLAVGLTDSRGSHLLASPTRFNLTGPVASLTF